MKWNEVKSFFKSWGVYPFGEPTDDYNQEVILQGINRACFHKMVIEARTLFGQSFAQFVNEECNGQDDAFFLRAEAETWSQLQDNWEAFQTQD